MDEDRLNSKISASEDSVYVEVFPGSYALANDQDASDLIVLCMENKVDRMLIHDGVFAESFFKLRTGSAGIFLQKFSNYSITAAIVIGTRGAPNSAFMEMASEINKGDRIHFFEEDDAAREWIACASECIL